MSPDTVQVFNALNMNLENKAHNYESPFLAAIFLLNNFHFMQKTFNRQVTSTHTLTKPHLMYTPPTHTHTHTHRNTHMLELQKMAFEKIEDHYDGLMIQHERAYQRGFTKLISFLGMDVSLGGGPTGDKVLAHVSLGGRTHWGQGIGSCQPEGEDPLGTRYWLMSAWGLPVRLEPCV